MQERKKEILLETVIKEYIKNPEPIGSEYIKMQLDIKISSATIRNYFKRMVEEGELAQLHISSGRIPTNHALKRYWKNRLLPLEGFNIQHPDTLSRAAREVGLFCIVKFYRPNMFKELINVSKRYLILVFDKGEMAIDYSPRIERFLEDLLGIDVMDLSRIAKQVCANTLAGKIELFIQDVDMVKEGDYELINMANSDYLGDDIFMETIEGRIVEKLHDGIYFNKIVPDGYMAVKQDITVKSADAKLFFIGRLDKNFDSFYAKSMAKSMRQS